MVKFNSFKFQISRKLESLETLKKKFRFEFFHPRAFRRVQ